MKNTHCSAVKCSLIIFTTRNEQGVELSHLVRPLQRKIMCSIYTINGRNKMLFLIPIILTQNIIKC